MALKKRSATPMLDMIVMFKEGITFVLLIPLVKPSNMTKETLQKDERSVLGFYCFLFILFCFFYRCEGSNGHITRLNAL